MWVAFHIFSANNINMFDIFQDRILNDTLDNNFVKLWTTGPWISANIQQKASYYSSHSAFYTIV